MPRQQRSNRKFNQDAPNLRRFRAAVEQLSQGDGAEDDKNIAQPDPRFQKPSVAKPRKQRRKEERQIKKARKNAFLQKKPLPVLPSEDEIRQRREEKELLRKQKKRLKEKQRKKRKKESNKESEKEEDTRVQGLLEANKVEDKMIKQLEKQMKMNRRKGKSLPKGFADEGLDYILDAVDSDKLNALYDSDIDGSDDEDASALKKLARGSGAGDDIKDEMDSDNDDEDNDDSDDDENDEDEDDDDDLVSGDEDEEVGESDETDNGSEAGDFDDDAADPEEKVPCLKRSHSDDEGDDDNDGDDDDDENVDDSEEKKPDFREDIYGRLRDTAGNVVQGAYVPPAKRMKAEGVSDKKKVQLDRLRKQLKGLINRLSENNLQSIANQIEDLYRRNSRAEMNEMLEALLHESYISTTLTPDRLAMEAAMLVALLHNNVDSEIGAHIIQGLAVKFDRMVKAGCNSETKELDNLLLFLSFLYSFKVFHSTLIFDILRMLNSVFTEKSIEMILLLLKNTGFSLRKDDAATLKDLLLSVQSKASGVDTSLFLP